MRLLLLTPDSSYAHDIGWALDNQVAALTAAGFAVDCCPWDRVGAVAGYDLLTALMAWNYHEQPHRWFTLLDRAEAEGWPLVNPPALLRWNSDKAYLAALADHGLPVVPTRAVARMDDAALAALRAAWSGTLVIKPAISANAMLTYRLAPGDPLPQAACGRPLLAQPFRAAIVDEGEWSLIYFDHRFSHALIKRPASGDFRVQPAHGGISEDAAAPAAARATADAILAALPQRATYARVDLVRHGAGFELMELELIEPALFLAHAPDAGHAFAAAFQAAAQRLGQQELAHG